MAASTACEVCIDSVAGAVAAERAGADRVELCANLLEGGTTPSAGMLQAVLSATNLPVMVMIRPRGGDFCFDETEQQVMLRELEAVLQHEPTGVVIGALTQTGQVDLALCAELIRRAGGLSVTFHRAFDHARDPMQSLDQLIGLEVGRILTSGQRSTAEQGIPLLRELVERAQDRVAIMAGAGVHPGNAARIVAETGVREIHFSGSMLVQSPVRFTRSDVPMRGEMPANDLALRVSSERKIREICHAIRAQSGDRI